MGAASVSSMTLQATWPHKVDAKAAILWSGLAKLSTVYPVMTWHQE